MVKYEPSSFADIEEKLPGMQREIDEESDCGIPLIPCAVSKPKARVVNQELRKEVDFLRNLRKEYEVNMLEVKKENLDLKINSKAIEDQRKDFLKGSSIKKFSIA